MVKTEFVRSLNCNYMRVLLDNPPDESRYQYCIMSRGGIRGLLPMSLRYINGLSYLFYDISSIQNVAQLYSGRMISREWMKDFLWGMQQVKLELARFLLDDRNIIWHPEQIYQNPEKNEFYFMYIPYFEGDCGFMSLIEYWVEGIDYQDEALVELIYRMHEQFELLGTIYLEEQIFEDAAILDKPLENTITEPENKQQNPLMDENENTIRNNVKLDPIPFHSEPEEVPTQGKAGKKGFRYLLEGRKKRQKQDRAEFRKETQQLMAGYAVCEDAHYGPDEADEEYGKTIYIEDAQLEANPVHRLFTKDGKLAAELTKLPFIIGKKKEDADYVLDDHTVSRVHARILDEDGRLYIEDLNSTNGTFKNGLRMQPYEKRILEKEDELKFGRVILIYR